MKEHALIRGAILVFGPFWGLVWWTKSSPTSSPGWAGFLRPLRQVLYSLGLKDPLFATVALAVSGLEAVNFTLYAVAALAFFAATVHVRKFGFSAGCSRPWDCLRCFPSQTRCLGTGSNCWSTGCFGILLASWVVFKFFASPSQRRLEFGNTRMALGVGLLLTLATSWSIRDFSASTFGQASAPVEGVEVVDGVWKFDFPFLADKLVWEQTVNAFEQAHPELQITYIYTGPSELNSKKKTHLLLYVFVEPR